jgi:hypothetical protein
MITRRGRHVVAVIEWSRIMVKVVERIVLVAVDCLTGGLLATRAGDRVSLVVGNIRQATSPAGVLTPAPTGVILLNGGS